VKHYFIEDESSHSVEQIPQSITYLKSLDKNKSGKSAKSETKEKPKKKSKS
jgi:hypothetical protein